MGETPMPRKEMQLGTVIGHATATIKHPSLNGWRMLIVQPLNAARQPEADCILAVDKLGAGRGELVVLNSDGKGARELIGDEHSPVRWFIIGLVDEVREPGLREAS
jgi:ethanolamine utilization protein EutN